MRVIHRRDLLRGIGLYCFSLAALVYAIIIGHTQLPQCAGGLSDVPVSAATTVGMIMFVLATWFVLSSLAREISLRVMATATLSLLFYVVFLAVLLMTQDGGLTICVHLIM